MAFRFNTMGAKIAEAPAEAARELADLLRRHGGYAVDAARELGVDYRTFARWLERLAAVGHDVRKLAGTPARKGRPKASDEPEEKPARKGRGERTPVRPRGKGGRPRGRKPARRAA